MRIGTAGWAIPRAYVGDLPGEGSHLARYARIFNAAEINSSFHRPHRPATYRRWAESVPQDFRFSVKLPKAITHQRKLIDCGALVDAFAEEIAGLGDRRGPVLVQLPPSLACDARIATAFFEHLCGAMDGPVVCEPRHASWFDAPADAMLATLGVSRVAADPAPVPAASSPGGARRPAYYRWHGSPVIYRSAYGDAAIEALAGTLAGSAGEPWVIFDNTASGAAMGDALSLLRHFGRGADPG